jgi:hypothetical protein
VQTAETPSKSAEAEGEATRARGREQAALRDLAEKAAVGPGSRVTRHDQDIDMGDRYERSIWEIRHQWDIDRDIDMGYVLSIWDMCYRCGISCHSAGQMMLDTSFTAC